MRVVTIGTTAAAVLRQNSVAHSPSPNTTESHRNRATGKRHVVARETLCVIGRFVVFSSYTSSSRDSKDASTVLYK